jgi:hypothetical protein
MSYCYDFIKKFRKEGNFCGLDKSEVSRLEAYIEIIEMLMKQHITEKTIVDNFPLGAARHLIPIKDERRADGLSFVTEQLKAGKHISGKDMQAKLEISNNKPEIRPESVKEPQSEKKQEPVILHPEIKKQDPVKCFSPQPGTIEVSDAPVIQSLGQVLKDDPPKPKPAPCLSGGKCPDGFNHIIQDKTQGAMCFLWKQALKQLPGDECYLDAKKRQAPKKDDGFGNKIIERAPYKIVAVPFTKSQFVEACRGYFTPKTLKAADDLVKSGVMGDDYAELVDALVWEAHGRMVT